MKLSIFLLLIHLPLTATAAEPIQLLDKGLSEWSYITEAGEQAVEKSWKLKDGILSTTGSPIGYLRTKQTFKQYTLTFQWRWLPETSKNNSGVLLHVSSPRDESPWPKSIEAQLQQSNAGDFWMIGETLEASGENKGGRWIRTSDPIEKPLGEWNTMIVKCSEDSILVHINGTLVNKAKNISTNEGAIAFQAEGSPIEIKAIEIEPME